MQVPFASIKHSFPAISMKTFLDPLSKHIQTPNKQMQVLCCLVKTRYPQYQLKLFFSSSMRILFALVQHMQAHINRSPTHLSFWPKHTCIIVCNFWMMFLLNLPRATAGHTTMHFGSALFYDKTSCHFRVYNLHINRQALMYPGCRMFNCAVKLPMISQWYPETQVWYPGTLRT